MGSREPQSLLWRAGSSGKPPRRRPKRVESSSDSEDEPEALQEGEAEDKRVHRVERSYGAFSRRFQLPAEIKTESISAVYNDGVLTVILPKAEAAKPKQIEVKVS